MIVECTCRFRAEGLADRKQAEVIADAHEARHMLRARQHDARVYDGDFDRLVTRAARQPNTRLVMEVR